MHVMYVLYVLYVMYVMYVMFVNACRTKSWYLERPPRREVPVAPPALGSPATKLICRLTVCKGSEHDMLHTRETM